MLFKSRWTLVLQRSIPIFMMLSLKWVTVSIFKMSWSTMRVLHLNRRNCRDWINRNTNGCLIHPKLFILMLLKKIFVPLHYWAVDPVWWHFDAQCWLSKRHWSRRELSIWGRWFAARQDLQHLKDKGVQMIPEPYKLSALFWHCWIRTDLSNNCFFGAVADWLVSYREPAVAGEWLACLHIFYLNTQLILAWIWGGSKVF